jgi:hypothetical protein
MAHTTRYGNTYSDAEWKLQQEMRAAEKRSAKFYQKAVAEIKEKAVRGLVHYGINAVVAEKIAGWICDYELDDAIERGALKFTSSEKEAAVRRCEAWVGEELKKVWDKVEEIEYEPMQRARSQFEY